MLIADIRQHVAAEYIPLHAELLAGRPRRFDKTHFQHDLLRLRHFHRVDDVRRELPRNSHRLVERGGIWRRAA